MGRLAGFKYRKVVQKLNKLGFCFLREWKWDHEIRYSQETNLYTTVPNKWWKDIMEGTLRAILRQWRIEVNDFLSK